MKESKQKAVELVENLKKVRNKNNQYYIIPITDDAIPLAIICVEEIIKLLDIEGYGNDYIIKFWQEVLTILKAM